MIYNDLIKIKNGYLAKHKNVSLPYSHLTHNVVKVLSQRKYVGNIKLITLSGENVNTTKEDGKNSAIGENLANKQIRDSVKEEKIKKDKKELQVELLYTEGVCHLNDLKFLSKPGRRLYAKTSQLKNVRQGYGDIIVSTSQGIMTARKAREKKLGGEIICEVF